MKRFAHSTLVDFSSATTRYPRVWPWWEAAPFSLTRDGFSWKSHRNRLVNGVCRPYSCLRSSRTEASGLGGTMNVCTEIVQRAVVDHVANVPCLLRGGCYHDFSLGRRCRLVRLLGPPYPKRWISLPRLIVFIHMSVENPVTRSLNRVTSIFRAPLSPTYSP